MSRTKLEKAGWYKELDDHVHWFHEKFQHEPMSYEEACATLISDTPEGWMDWSKSPLITHVKMLEEHFKFSSAGVAKSAYELCKFYRDNMDRDPNLEGNQLYEITDSWARINSETNRVISEGTKQLAKVFTKVEAQKFFLDAPRVEEQPKFNQRMEHTYEMKLIENNPLM